MNTPLSDPLEILLLAGVLCIVLLLSLCFAAGVLYGLYFLLTLPMRRNERARFFLDLLELGLKNGQTPERAVLEASSSNDRSLGARFYKLADALRGGLTLKDALARVPRLLPPRVTAMLQAGLQLGDISKVFPACRQRLQDSVSHVRGALNYLLILGLVTAPLSLVTPMVIRIKILPKFREVFEGLFAGADLPALTRFVFDQNGAMFLIQLLLFAFTWLVLIGYIGGPRWRRRFNPVLLGLPDWLELHLPWRRKRLQRDFSAMLAILLDAGVPEAKAASLAADSTVNRIMVRRARRIAALLCDGVKLPDALRAADDSGELHWRFANASRRGKGFLQALSGWHEALDGKAFQLEQAAAQLTTTALVLLNGLIIGLFVAGMFMALINLLNNAALW